VAAASGEIARGGFDVAHATLPVPGANVYQPRGGLVGAQAAASVRRRRGLLRALFATCEPLNLLRRKMGELERRVVGDEKVLCLAVSDMVRREFLHYYGRGQGVRVVFNGVDAPGGDEARRQQWRGELRSRLGIPAGDCVFLTVAKNFALKGVPEALEAFARHVAERGGDAGAHFVAVGQALTGWYERRARRRRVSRLMHFPGPAEDASPWYAAADVCVLLTWYDPCSRVVLEALRAGLPAVTTAFNGAAEVLGDGAGVVVASPDDTAGAAAAMRTLADPAARRQAAGACRAVAGRLTMERQVDELLAAYEEVA